MISWIVPVKKRGYEFDVYVDFDNDSPFEFCQKFRAQPFKDGKAIGNATFSVDFVNLCNARLSNIKWGGLDALRQIIEYAKNNGIGWLEIEQSKRELQARSFKN